MTILLKEENNMCCIGIISQNVELINSLTEKYKVIIITKQNLEKYLDYSWDICIIEDKMINEKELEILGNNSKYIILSDNLNLDIKLKNKVNIITFGFHHKSTVTISSIDEENIVICIQRTIQGLSGKAIEQQEKRIPNTGENEINNNIIKKIIEEITEK